MRRDRRRFLRDAALVSLGSKINVCDASAQVSDVAVVIDPEPLYDISQHLYMQFMEPLGTTDGSVEAAWDYRSDDWRQDLINVVQDLSPGMVRYGGLFCRYYKWREGVGSAKSRPVMKNYIWGGIESNRVGTPEFVDFCRRVGAEPLMCVNFLSDGDHEFWKAYDGQRRFGDAREAAEWVSYANEPENRERRAHGIREPLTIKHWQLGNEVSYGEGWFSKEEAIRQTIVFARAMKERDTSLKLIGWGDRGPKPEKAYWAGDLIQRAGEHLDCVAMHMMGQTATRPNSVLNGRKWRQEPEQAWDELLELSNRVEVRISEFEQVVSSASPTMGIAVTEGHLSLQPYNTNPILFEWITGMYHARSMNIYQRHGARVKIATAADFFGTRWSVNAVLMPMPDGPSYLMPVGSVMRLFSRHNGKKGVAVKSAPSDLDIAASRTDDRVYLHVANLSYSHASDVSLKVHGMKVTGGRVIQIAPQDPLTHVSELQPKVLDPIEKPLPPGPAPRWRFPAASVSVVEMDMKS